MSDDQIKVWLHERRTIHAAATEGPWEFDLDGDIQGRRKGRSPDPEMDPIVGVLDREEDSAAIVDAHNHFPAALDAIEAALNLHRLFRYYEHEDVCTITDEDHRNERHVEFAVGEYYCEDLPTGEVVCDSCRDEDGEQVDYPCDTRRELEGAVGNER